MAREDIISTSAGDIDAMKRKQNAIKAALASSDASPIKIKKVEAPSAEVTKTAEKVARQVVLDKMKEGGDS